MDRDQQSSEMETLDLLWFDLKKKILRNQRL